MPAPNNLHTQHAEADDLVPAQAAPHRQHSPRPRKKVVPETVHGADASTADRLTSAARTERPPQDRQGLSRPPAPPSPRTASTAGPTSLPAHDIDHARPRWQWQRGAQVFNAATAGPLLPDAEAQSRSPSTHDDRRSSGAGAGSKHPTHWRRARLLRVRIRRGQQPGLSDAPWSAHWASWPSAVTIPAVAGAQLHRRLMRNYPGGALTPVPAIAAAASLGEAGAASGVPLTDVPSAAMFTVPPGVQQSTPRSALSTTGPADAAQLSMPGTLIILGAGIAVGLVVVLLVWLLCHLSNQRYHRQLLLKEPKRPAPHLHSQSSVAIGPAPDAPRDRQREQAVSMLPLVHTVSEEADVHPSVSSSRRPSTRILAVGASHSIEQDNGHPYKGPMPAVTLTSPSPTPSKAHGRAPDQKATNRSTAYLQHSASSEDTSQLLQPLLAAEVDSDVAEYSPMDEIPASIESTHTEGMQAPTSHVTVSTSTGSDLDFPHLETTPTEIISGILATLQYADDRSPTLSVSPKIEGSPLVFSRGHSHPLMHPHFHSQSSDDLPIPDDAEGSTSPLPSAGDAGSRLSWGQGARPATAQATFIHPLWQEAKGQPATEDQTPSEIDLTGQGPNVTASAPSCESLTEVVHPTPWPVSVPKDEVVDVTAPNEVDEASTSAPVPVRRQSVPDPCIALWELRSALESSSLSPGSADDGYGQTPRAIRLFPFPRSDAGGSFEEDPGGGRLPGQASSPTADDDFLSSALVQQLQSASRTTYYQYAASGTLSTSSTVPVSLLTSLTSFESNTPSEESFDASNCARAIEAIFDEPSDLPVSEEAHEKPPGPTHLTPPAYTAGRQKVKVVSRLTSQQKRQSFKKAHRSSAPQRSSTQPVTASQLAQATAAAATAIASSLPEQQHPPLPPSALASALPADMASCFAVQALAVSLELVSLSRDEVGRPVVPERSGATSPNRLQLQHMKSDSGYKSQSFDATCSAGHAAVGAVLIHSFKSVPALPLESEQELPAVKLLPTAADLKPFPFHLPRDRLVAAGDTEAGGSLHHLAISTEYDDTITDCSFELSDALPSLTSSTDQDRRPPARSAPLASCNNEPSIPLLLHPATPTSPSAPTSPVARADWSVDAMSDRLFREYSGASGRYNLTVVARSSKRRSRGQPYVPRTREIRAALKHAIAAGPTGGNRRSSKLGHYSGSSSHSGTPAQASIEETEEEEQEGSVSSSSTGATQCTVIQVEPMAAAGFLEEGPPGEFAGPAEQSGNDTSASAPEEEMERRSPPTAKVQAAEQPPDFIICSTREQLTRQLTLRSRSPQLRHVPIIKLPEHESDEV